MGVSKAVSVVTMLLFIFAGRGCYERTELYDKTIGTCEFVR